MTSVDDPNPNLFERVRRVLGPLESHLNEDVGDTYPIVCLAIAHKRDGRWHPGFIRFGRSEKDNSLFQNGAVFIRLMTSALGLCLSAICLGMAVLLHGSLWWGLVGHFIGIQVRWSGAEGVRRQYLQAYGLLCWKLNGEAAIGPRFRIQSRASAAVGTTGQNSGQADGWNEGPT